MDDNVLTSLDRGIILERTTQARLRGNLFDGVKDWLVVDIDGRDAEVLGNIAAAPPAAGCATRR